VLTARARDAAGNTATAGPLSVTVSNTAPPVAGLVAAYNFDEGAGTMLNDLSGRNNHGVVTGAAWSAAGRNGGALSFNGSSNWVTVADAATLDLTNGMTVEAWVRPAALSGWRTVVMKETASGHAYSLYAHNNTPNPAVTITVGTADRTAAGSSALPLNTWSHLAATYNGSALRLYVNGVQVRTINVTGNMATSSAPLRIGGNAVWGEYFSGLVDDVRVYSRALTVTEIQTDMNTGVR
jgi:hypothetical protein